MRVWNRCSWSWRRRAVHMRKLWVLLKLNFRAMLRAFSFRSGAGSSKKEGRGRPGSTAANGLFGAVPFRRVQLFAGLHAGGGGHRGDGAAFDGADGLRDVADVYIIRSQRSCVRRQGQRYRAGAAGAGLYRDAEQDPGAVPGKSCVLRAVDAAHRRGLSGVCGAGSGAGCGLLCAAACRRIVFCLCCLPFWHCWGAG